MRPTAVFTYAMLGLAGSVAAQVDSSQDDNGLVARSRVRHGSVLTNMIRGGRSPGIANMSGRKGLRFVSDEDEHQLEARSPIRSIIKAPAYVTSRRGRGRRSVSDDDEHQLETRSPIKLTPSRLGRLRQPRPTRFRPLGSSKKSRSEDDELFERGFDAEEFEEEY
ncbi:unnamed protein product [Clonostachys rhizophaga]|uniref:Uncharacterized protein n=1 Tax=Clonostachys rhizophaga TaxID=160324 RepID=A0A9N9W3D0_9HYPO|nr:unnamed protein product [Clonostachys rhizophaga]